jgi:hypothetical protein
MIPTPKEARADLADHLATPALGEPVRAVYDHEPDRETAGACWVTVDVDSIDPDEIRLAVRVYVQFANVGAQLAADLRDDAVALVDARMDTSSTWGPSRWTFGLNEELQALVAELNVAVGREDLLS